jgi:UPF0716 family protein affecting phage T7 exclusion
VNGSAVFAWLHAQGADMVANIGDIAANRPEPARQMVFSTLMTAAAIWLILQIAKKVPK